MSENVIELALKLERSTIEFYRYARENSDDPILKDFFNSMVLSKRKFERNLEKYKNNPESLLVAGSDQEHGLSEEFEDDEIIFKPGMELKNAVALAMKNEEKLKTTYESMIDLEEDLNEKNLLRDMANACSIRMASLEKIYNNIAFNEVW